jgi:hypothetical protein
VHRPSGTAIWPTWRGSRYEVYRFGGAELAPDDPQAPARVETFFDDLLARHRD